MYWSIGSPRAAAGARARDAKRADGGRVAGRHRRVHGFRSISVKLNDASGIT